MKMPSTQPMISGHKEKLCGSAVTKDGTPAKLQDLMSFIRSEGKHFTEAHWNDVVEIISKFTKGNSYTGNDYLSMMGTFITHMTATWILFMKKIIADQDDACVGIEDLVEPICDGIKLIVRSAK